MSIEGPGGAAPARVDASALAASLRRLKQRHEGAVLERSLRRVLDSCVELFGVSGSGLMLADEHSDLHYVVATDEASARLETAELDSGEGPCVETFLRNEIVACNDLLTDTRWPRLARRVAGAGVGAVLGVPVRMGDIAVGAMDVYLRGPHDWDESEIAALDQFGRIADAMIAAAVGVRDAGHIGMESLLVLLPDRLRDRVELLIHALILIFGAAMAYNGWILGRSVMHYHIANLGVSEALRYVPLSLSGVLIVLFSIEHILALWRGEEVQPSWH